MKIGELEIAPCADLIGEDLRGADLRGADLRRANLSSANLSGAGLSGVDLRDANLSSADLRGANLRSANLRGVDLRDAKLSRADLSGADLRDANLRGADLYCANLRGADLRDADLSGTDLSGAKGLPSASEWLSQHFQSDSNGVICYRAQVGEYPTPDHWKFEPGAYLEETTNPDRGTLCACGVSFATVEWVRDKYPRQPVWRCRIEWIDLADVIVPFGTDGKARARRVKLLEIVENKP